MAAVFGGVLLLSFGLERLFAPAGDALTRALDGRQITITGTIESGSHPNQLALHQGRSTYYFSDQTPAVGYARREVRVTGVLHRSTGLLDIESIQPVRTSK